MKPLTPLTPQRTFPLPADAIAIDPPTSRSMGTWSNEMTYDAEMTRHGVKWYRVRGGFGGRFDREDWVADLACLQELLCGLQSARNKKKSAESVIVEMNKAIDLLSGLES